MSLCDRNDESHAAIDELASSGVHRRSFLKYAAALFSAAALPEAIAACGSSGEGSVGEVASDVDFSASAMTWVTRKQDGLSLGFQFVNIVADTNHNIALASGTAAGNAYVAITFPPQHVMEDALNLQAGNTFAGYPLHAYASATSRIVFQIPAAYGVAVDAGGIAPLPYTLAGMLELCTMSTPVVAPNAMTSAGTTHIIGIVPLAEEEDKTPESLSQARIDRVIARVDSKAAARVRRRAVRAARMLSSEVQGPAILRFVHTGTAPVTPTNGQTSIELPFRLQMSPNEDMRWSFQSAPVGSPNTLAADSARTELWHAKMAWADPVTGLPNLAIGGLTLRALYTRDWDVYGVSSPAGTYSQNLVEPAAGAASPYVNDPVDWANPAAPNREAIVLLTGNMTGSAPPPINVNRLILSPAGGTLDAELSGGTMSSSGTFTPTLPNPADLIYWKQSTVLGRDEFVECVNAVTVLPGGWPGTLTIINKRNDIPNNPAAPGIPVGVVYSQTYLTIHTPLVSYVGASNAADYNTFPFRAMEITQTKIPCSNAAGASGPVKDPTGQFNVTVGAVGTDWRGNRIQFQTILVVLPQSATVQAAQFGWNGMTFNGSSPPLLMMNGQRIAFAAPADGSGATSTSYSADSTSFETTSFVLAFNSPSNYTASSVAAQAVPQAQKVSLAVEAVRHLQSSPSASTPTGQSTYDYDHVVYAANGFSASANPNEIFMTLSSTSVPAAGSGPGINFTQNAAQSGGLAAPALAASALSRSAGIMSGTVAAAGAKTAPTLNANSQVAGLVSSANLYNGGFNPADVFNGFSPQLFGFVPLTAILPALEGAASQFMPKAITKELSEAESFLETAMALYNLLGNLVAETSGGLQGAIQSILSQVQTDITAYGQMAEGIVADGGSVAGGLGAAAAAAPLTNAQKAQAAALASAAASAQTTINGYLTSLTTIYGDAVAVYNDVTGLEFGSLITLAGTGDLPTFVTAVEQFATQVETLTGVSGSAPPNPQTAAGAVLKYFGSVINAIKGALNDVNAVLQAGESVVSTLVNDLAALSQGLDMARNMSVDFNWKPIITGLQANEVLAFIPKSNQGFSLDIDVNASASNGNPAGVNITIRLDSFAICFGQGIPTPAPGTPIWTVGPITAGAIPCGYSTVQQNADVSLIFDHMQVQMLAGQKPDVDIVFSDIYFGGDLSFVETLKNLIPVDAFSDPPFLNIDTSGITAGFTLAIPNVAVGMFSIQNMAISASLTIPFLSTGPNGGANGISFTFGFCSIDNPFVVTVAMLGGGGFFTMTMGMNGLQGVALGVQVEAQLAIDIVVASGSVSIEVGIFLVYWDPDNFVAGPDPVSGQAKEKGWLIGGYLRLRGELDVCGIITISVELYLQITYSPSTGKCIASGFIAIDVSLFCFSVSANVPFSRQFSGSNGDPTLAELMSPGGVDPMLDPTLLNTTSPYEWDPFAEYCMAYT